MLTISGKSVVDLYVNNGVKSVAVRPADTLLDVLRNELGLTGAKNSCGNGECGSCTVLVDGLPVKSCLMLAVEAIGHKITTIEGIYNDPIQIAFVEKFAVQCGYCTPGIIMNCHALINTHPHASDEVIEEWLESNICRCTGYQEIREALASVMGS